MSDAYLTPLELDASDPVWEAVRKMVKLMLMHVEYAENGKAVYRYTKEGLRVMEQFDNE